MAEAFAVRDALQTVADLPHYEESLTARASGMTWMAWGLVAAGTFMTYAAMHGLDHEARWMVVMGFSWVPWVAAGIVSTLIVWRSHAIALRRRDRTGRRLLRSLLILVAFLVVLYGLILLYQTPLADDWNMAGLIILAHALMTAIAAIALRRTSRHRAVRRNLAAAAVALLGAGVLLTASSVDMGVVLMLGAPIVGGAWFAAGVATFLQG